MDAIILLPTLDNLTLPTLMVFESKFLPFFYGDYQMSTIIAMIAMQSELETILSSSTSVGIELPAINLFKEPHWI